MKLPPDLADLLHRDLSRAHRIWESNGRTRVATCHCGERYSMPDDADIGWMMSMTCPQALRVAEAFGLFASSP